MKLYEIEHINQDYNPNKVMGEELRFVSSIGSICGKSYKAEKQPKDWGHVKRLTHMLFLAWNDDNPLEGTVYLGELYNPKSEDDEFYEFFNEFNQFPISDAQKRMYSVIKNGGYTSRERQCGSTTLLLTIAAYEAAIKDKYVVYFSHNIDTAKLYQREFNNKWFNLPFVYNLPKNVLFRTFGTNMDIFRGHYNARVFFDNIRLFAHPSIMAEQLYRYDRVAGPIPDIKMYFINTH
jgi:hypothetical protein